jgi:hypothetical protein
MARSPWQRARVRLGRITLRYRNVWPPDLPRPEPPDLDAGLVTGPPDFVGIGAPRCGSTWWSRALGRQPGVRRSASKELHWFDPFVTRDLSPEEGRTYRDHFPRAEGEITGEWTPGYLYQPWTPALLRSVAPDTRLLAILRDPIDQIESSINYSHTFHGARNNPLMITRHLGEAQYGTHLAHWHATFPAPRLLLQYERCRDEPEKEMHRTLDFLGLDRAQVPDDRGRGTRSDRPKPIRLTRHTRQALVEMLTPDVIGLAEAHPEVDPGRWPNFAHLT